MRRVYGTVRTVVWEDGGGDPASYPIMYHEVGEIIYAPSPHNFGVYNRIGLT